MPDIKTKPIFPSTTSITNDDTISVIDDPSGSPKEYVISRGNFIGAFDIDLNTNDLLDFGYIQSTGGATTDSGTIRLGNAQNISWRNFADNANITLTINASDVLALNGTAVSLAGHTHVASNITDLDTATVTFTNKTMVFGSNTLTDVMSTTTSQSVTAGAKKSLQASGTTAGLRLVGAGTDPSGLEQGDVWYRTDTNRLSYRGSATRRVVAEDLTQTLTNKTLTSPTLTSPVLGTPTSGTLTNCTGLPIVAGTTGTLSVARGGTGVTTSTGTGNVVLSTSPTFTTPILGTPTSGTLTNCTGLPIVAGTTGTLSVARGGTGVTSSTGTGSVVLSTSPTLTTPVLGTPTSGTLTNCTGLPAGSITYTINAQTGTTYTPVLSDRSAFVTLSNAGAITLTIPPNSSVAYATGTVLNFIQIGAGQVTIQQGSGVTITSTGATVSAPKIRAQHGSASAIKTATNTWRIVGDIE